MISTGQILAAGAITGAAVAIAAAAGHWRVRWLAASAIGAVVAIIAWRALSNLLALNGDFVPAISVGDVGCLLVGAVAPAAVVLTGRVPARLRWIPVGAGALAGFLVNVVIL